MSTQDRKNAIEMAGTGGALLAGSAAVNEGLDRRLRQRNAPGLIPAAYRTATGKKNGLDRATHLPHAAGRFATRSVQLAALPLLAVGTKNAITGHRTRKVDITQDVVKPTVKYATLQDQVKRGESQLSKSDLMNPRMPWDKRSDELRAAARRKRTTEANLDLAGAGVAGAVLPAVAYGAGKVGGPHAKAVSSAAKTMGMGVSGNSAPMARTARIVTESIKSIPGRPGRVLRHPLTLAGAGLALGAPVVSDNNREHKKAKAEYKRLKDEYKSVGKSLTQSEQARLDRHRKLGRNISLTSGTLGLAALGLRAPQAARALENHGVKGVRRLAAHEMRATSLSNTLGIGAIGAGSAGSFNYAAQQRLERKREAVNKALTGGNGLRRAVQRFQTANPHGPNSTYHKLPDGRWLREKHSTGEQHVQDRTVFVHPAYGHQVHPTLNKPYSPLEMALAHGDLVHPGGRIGIRVAHADGPSTVHGVPDHHISHEPKEGWHPVEYSLHPDGRVKSYHLGHPVAPLERGAYSDHFKYGDEIGKSSIKAVSRFARTFDQVAGPVRRSKPMTELGGRVERHFDRRANDILQSILPSDELQSGARLKNPSWLVNTKGRSVSGLGSRVFQAKIQYPTKNGRWANAGFIEAMVLPTGHIKINSVKIDEWARGQGIASGMVREVRANLRDSKSPGMLWRSAGYAEDKGPEEGGLQGYTAWRQKGIKYVPGMAYGRWPSMAVYPQNTGLSPKAARQVRRHVLAARLGMTTPERARTKMSQEAQDYLGGTKNGQPIDWYGMIPGGQPFLGKTRKIAGATALAGVPAYGTYRWQENQHPRGYGGHFINKGMPTKAWIKRNNLPVNVLHPDGPDHFMVVHTSHRMDGLRQRFHRDELRYATKNQTRLTPVSAKTQAKPTQMELQFEKSFLGKYGDRLSPEAEGGYRHLRFERNENIGSAAFNTGVASLSAAGLISDRVKRANHAPRMSRSGTALTALTGTAAAYGALKSTKTAQRRNKSMNKIEEKARARAKQGLYGPGRGLEPVDMSSKKARKYTQVQGMDGAPE